MRKLFTIALFWSFLTLCVAEILPKFIISFNNNGGQVVYSSGKEPVTESEHSKEKNDHQNYQKLLKEFNADGA